MLLGAHESAAGGCHHVFEHCARDRADAVQLWTRSSRQWASKPLTAEAIAAFHEAHKNYQAQPIPAAAHASYLINLATANPAVYDRSIATLLEEAERAEQLGIGQVIFHPGATQDNSEADGIKRVAEGLQAICQRLDGARVRLLVECTAGQGRSIGCSFAQIAQIVKLADRARIGVCLDTQHMYASGIDWTTEAGYRATFAEFDALIGLEHLQAFHMNDSKKPLGSRVDRHAVIGDGHIGLEPFRRLVNDSRFAKIPGFLETPPLENGEESYALGLSRLRSLL